MSIEVFQVNKLNHMHGRNTLEDHRSVLYAYNKLLGQRTGVRFPNIDESNMAKSQVQSISNVDDDPGRQSSTDNSSDAEDEYTKLIDADDSDEEEDANKQSHISRSLTSKAQGVRDEGKRDSNKPHIDARVQSGQKRKYSESQSSSHNSLQLSLSIAVPTKASQWTSPSPAKDAHIRLWKESKENGSSTKKVRFGQNNEQGTP